MAVVFYLCLFQPKVPVSIEDVYTGDVHVVDGVPLGIAVTGHLTSTIGYTLTQWFDQGFSLPHSGSALTESGYISALEMMSTVRRFLSNKLNYTQANTVGGSNIAQSWYNYILDCTLIGVDVRAKTVDDIFKVSNPFEALRFESENYTTEYTPRRGNETQYLYGGP